MSFHSHPCRYARFGCENTILCPDSNLERNYDGFPEIICTLEILGTCVDFPCDECEDKKTCEYCGAPEHFAHDEDCDFWIRESPLSEVPIEAYEEQDAFV